MNNKQLLFAICSTVAAWYMLQATDAMNKRIDIVRVDKPAGIIVYKANGRTVTLEVNKLVPNQKLIISLGDWSVEATTMRDQFNNILAVMLHGYSLKTGNIQTNVFTQMVEWRNL